MSLSVTFGKGLSQHGDVPWVIRSFCSGVDGAVP
jgi:hypothetical protein